MLLGSFAEIASSDIEELEASLSANAGGKGFEFALRDERFSFRVNAARQKETSLLWIGTRSKVTVSFGATDYARRVFQIRSRARAMIGRSTIDCSPSTAGFVVPPNCDDWRVQYDDGGFECLSLRVDERALLRKLNALTGAECASKLAFDQPSREMTRRDQLLRQAVTQFAVEMDQFGSQLTAATLGEFEQELIFRFLLYSHHNYNHLFERTPTLASIGQLTRIEDYIYANWDQKLDIETLSHVAGVSGRTLFRMFIERHGCSPHEFVQQVRLQRARNFLLESADGVTVSSVAFRCGFSNPGHFARAYRCTFGELPSDTLRRPLSRMVK